MSLDWLRLFPDVDYRPAMNLRVIDGSKFFQTTDEGILQQRRTLLQNAPEFYCCGNPDTRSLARFLKLSDQELGCQIEPDWVLLKPGFAGQFLVTGGCVCFPTMWSLPEKLGLPLSAIHDPVPGLNAALAAKIDQFLARLSPGSAYGRENWGLSASDALDQHPRHRLPEIAADPSLDHVWLRVEEQTLIRLDDGQIVFGIRINNLRLDQIADSLLRSRLARTLRSLSPEMASYKRFAQCRERLASKLELSIEAIA